MQAQDQAITILGGLEMVQHRPAAGAAQDRFGHRRQRAIMDISVHADQRMVEARPPAHQLGHRLIAAVRDDRQADAVLGDLRQRIGFVARADQRLSQHVPFEGVAILAVIDQARAGIWLRSVIFRAGRVVRIARLPAHIHPSQGRHLAPVGQVALDRAEGNFVTSFTNCQVQREADQQLGRADLRAAALQPLAGDVDLHLPCPGPQ